MSNPISEIMNETMGKIKELVDVNTIVGNPITTPDGITLIPVSKVMFGFTSGGADGKEKTANAQPARFAAGAGAGISIVPVAFIVISGENTRMLYVDAPTNTTLDKIVDMVPGVIDKFKKSSDL